MCIPTLVPIISRLESLFGKLHQVHCANFEKHRVDPYYKIFEITMPTNFNPVEHKILSIHSHFTLSLKLFGAHFKPEVRFSSAVKCKKGPQALTSRLNQRRNYYHFF